MLKVFFFAFFLISAGFCQAATCDPCPRVYAGLMGGYGVVSGMYDDDGQSAQYRFSLGLDAYKWENLTLAVEAGVQSGSTMRAKMDADLQALSGGLLPQVILNPFWDFLIALRYHFNSPFYALLKGGIAYRQMHFVDRTSSKDSLNRINGECQAGFGYQLTQKARLFILYQGIFASSNLGFSVNATEVLMNNMPTQQAAFIGVEYTF